MGQHKYNQTAIDAKEGKLPPKPKKLSTRETDRIINAKLREILYKPFCEAFETMDKYS
jgi:hypothetical protein